MTEPNVCHQCGHHNPHDARFCSSCGAALTAPSAATYVATDAATGAADKPVDIDLTPTVAVDIAAIVHARNDDGSTDAPPSSATHEYSAPAGDTPFVAGEAPIITQFEQAQPGQGILVVRRGAEGVLQFALGTDPVNIGRHPDSEIVLDDITVSRRHVQITQSADGYVASDMGSLNGTYVNRSRIESAVLGNGDELQVGKFKITFLTAAGE